jgi:hypothetical protein
VTRKGDHGKSPSDFKAPDQPRRYKTRLKVRKDIPPPSPVRTTYDPTIRLSGEEERRLSSFGTLRQPRKTTSTTNRTWE